MINIHCLLAIYCLEINHFRIDLLTAFFTLGVFLPQRLYCPSSQMLITKQNTKLIIVNKEGNLGQE